MKYDNLNQEEMQVEKVQPHNEVVKKGLKFKKIKPKLNKNRDTIDYVILQTGIACGILALLLVVNVAANGFEPLKNVFTLMSNVISKII
ncbi:MAG: hypothetical protein RR458_06810 [Clostridia bacterium]